MRENRVYYCRFTTNKINNEPIECLGFLHDSNYSWSDNYLIKARSGGTISTKLNKDEYLVDQETRYVSTTEKKRWTYGY